MLKVECAIEVLYRCGVLLEATLVVIVIITVTFHNRKIILHKAILESAPTPTGEHYILTPRTKEKAS